MALMVITLLGAMSVVGIQATAIDMRNIADKTYKEHGLYDVHLKSATGFDADDEAAIRNTAGAAEVMFGYSLDVYADIRQVLSPVRTYSLPGNLNTLDVHEGRLPEKADECVIDKKMMTEAGYVLGDSISLSLDDMDAYDEKFQTRSFTITGVVSSPLYISYERGRTTLGTGGVAYYIYLPPEAYTLEVYTDVYVIMEGSRETYTLSDTYTERADSWKETLKDTGDLRVADAQKRLKEAQEEIDNGWQEYNDGLTEADKKIAEGREELVKALAKLTRAKTSLISNQKTLDDKIASANAELNEKILELNAGQNTLNQRLAEAGLSSAQAEITQARAALNAQLAALQALGARGDSAELDAQYSQIDAGIAQLDAKQAELNAGKVALESAQAEIDRGRAEIEKAKATLETERADAQAKINSGWAEYTKGMAEYNAGVATLNQEEEDAQSKLADAKTELEDAQATLDSVPDPEWYAFTRKEGASFESYYQDTLRLEKVGYVFPMVFFLVAVLVSLTTISRMVEEQRTQIGVYKALGYRPAAIMMKYAIYALISGLLGSGLGILVGSYLLPPVIMDAYGHLYTMPAGDMSIPLEISIFAVTVSVGAVLAVTLGTCANAMKGEPALLMRPKSPKAGKKVFLEKIPFIWNALGFIGKVTSRNIFRYKRRFFMTLAGIAGCAALLLTAFGLRDSIGSVAPLQYESVITYDAKVYLKDIVRPGQRTALDTLTPETRQYIREESVKVKASPSGSAVTDHTSVSEMTAYLIVPEGSTLEGFIQLLSPETGKVVPVPAQGALLTEKAARALKVSPGDPIILTGVDEESAVLTTVAGIVENYISHYIYMAPDQYTQLFGHELYPNGLLLQGDFDQEALMKDENVRAVALTTDLLSLIGDSTDALGIVTIVLLVLACALAFVVLFTLTIINISERMRELATIKVLGFQDTETAFYMYRENVVVTLIGIGIGLVGGIFLNTFVLSSVEVDVLKFPHEIYPMSFVLAAALSLVFALLVNALMYRKLVAIDMVESLKSVD